MSRIAIRQKQLAAIITVGQAEICSVTNTNTRESRVFTTHTNSMKRVCNTILHDVIFSINDALNRIYNLGLCECCMTAVLNNEDCIHAMLFL